MGQSDLIHTRMDPSDRTQWWTGIVQAYLDPVWRFVRARVPADCADDIAQEVFLAAARSASRGAENPRNPWPWLLGIARHKVADYFRRSRHAVSLEAPWHDLADEQAGIVQALRDESPLPEQVAQQAELGALARAALSALDPPHRACLVARYYHDLSLEQIAHKMNLSRAAANSLLHRARQQLREAFLALIDPQAAREEFGP